MDPIEKGRRAKEFSESISGINREISVFVCVSVPLNQIINKIFVFCFGLHLIYGVKMI